MTRRSLDVRFRSFGGLLSIFVFVLSLLGSTSYAFQIPASTSQSSSFVLHAKKNKKKKKINDGSKTICVNRAARRNYEVLETLEAGVSLKGTEVKSIRDGKMNIKDGWIKPNKNGRSCELMNVHISRHSFTGMHDQHEEKRPRPLLIHKEQARKFAQQVEQNNGLTIVPLKAYFNLQNKVKFEIALCRGKNVRDKRADIKEREFKREEGRIMKNFRI